MLKPAIVLLAVLTAGCGQPKAPAPATTKAAAAPSPVIGTWSCKSSEDLGQTTSSETFEASGKYAARVSIASTSGKASMELSFDATGTWKIGADGLLAIEAKPNEGGSGKIGKKPMAMEMVGVIGRAWADQVKVAKMDASAQRLQLVRGGSLFVCTR